MGGIFEQRIEAEKAFTGGFVLRGGEIRAGLCPVYFARADGFRTTLAKYPF
jgi:hypothetical protein